MWPPSVLVKMDFHANTVLSLQMRDKSRGSIGISPSFDTSAGLPFPSQLFPPSPRPTGSALLLTGEIQVISINQPYSGSLEERSSSSPSLPSYIPKTPKDNTFGGWQVIKKFRRRGDICWSLRLGCFVLERAVRGRVLPCLAFLTPSVVHQF